MQQVVHSLAQALGIVCGRGYEVGVIFLFSSKNEIVVTVLEMFESEPVKSGMYVFPDTFSTLDGRPENSKSGCM